MLYAVGTRMEKWPTAFLSSRTLAQYSTVRDAGGLNCRVRNGTGCYTAAMAVVPKLCILTSYITLILLPEISCGAERPAHRKIFSLYG